MGSLVRVARTAVVCLCALAGVALLSAAAGCASPSDAADPSPTPVAGGTYVVPLEWDPPSIEPLNTYDSEAALVNAQVFEGLVRWETGSDGIVRGVPGIAESWTAGDDATVWTFRLKRGVRFQPPVGREVTARDVVAGWNYVADPANESFVAYLFEPIRGADTSGYAAKGLTGVKALDRYTLQVTLKYPLADFPLRLGHPATRVWPVDYMREVSREAFRNRPVGTGPYAVDRWVHGEYIDLVRNPDYWDPERAGHVDRVHLPIMDVSTQWEEFQKGRIDITSVPPDQIAAAKDHPRVRDGTWQARAWPTLTLIMVGMSQKSSQVGGAANLPLREALSRAVDRAAVIRARDVVSVPATGIVPDGILHADAGGLAYPYDPEEAARLAEGIAPLPALRYLSFGAAAESTEGLGSSDDILLAGWREAGLDVERRGYEYSSWVRKVSKGTEGDLFITGWIADYPSPDDFLSLLFHSSSSGAESVSTFYQDPQVDGLLEQARRTLDEDRRLDLYAQAERKILADAPVIPLYFWHAFRVADSRVQGQALDPMSAIDMAKVWVTPATD